MACLGLPLASCFIVHHGKPVVVNDDSIHPEKTALAIHVFLLPFDPSFRSSHKIWKNLLSHNEFEEDPLGVPHRKVRPLDMVCLTRRLFEPGFDVFSVKFDRGQDLMKKLSSPPFFDVEIP